MSTNAALDGAWHLHPPALPAGRQLVTRTGHEDKPFGYNTLLPLVRLGLLDPVQEPDRRLSSHG